MRSDRIIYNAENRRSTLLGFLVNAINVENSKQQGMQQGMQRGSREIQLQIARNMLNANMSMQQVAALTRLTLSEAQQLQKARN